MRMTLRTLTLSLAVISALMIGCGDDSSDSSTPAATTDTGTTTDTGAADTTASDTTVADTGPVESAPTFDEHIQPILEANCGNCHGTAGEWGASSYEDSQKAAYSAQCSGLTKGECYAVRIKDETMPTGGSVLSAMTDSGDLELLDQWIAAGMPEN